mmetsp:Transcript_37069/g.93015  ORF Transcript_37069/g.93015 Transcript_37069/m.93015 type:complete len:346 (+) Transcript_37069:402-1439(+)
MSEWFGLSICRDYCDTDTHIHATDRPTQLTQIRRQLQLMQPPPRAHEKALYLNHVFLERDALPHLEGPYVRVGLQYPLRVDHRQSLAHHSPPRTHAVQNLARHVGPGHQAVHIRAFSEDGVVVVAGVGPLAVVHRTRPYDGVGQPASAQVALGLGLVHQPHSQAVPGLAGNPPFRLRRPHSRHQHKVPHVTPFSRTVDQVPIAGEVDTELLVNGLFVLDGKHGGVVPAAANTADEHIGPHLRQQILDTQRVHHVAPVHLEGTVVSKGRVAVGLNRHVDRADQLRILFERSFLRLASHLQPQLLARANNKEPLNDRWRVRGIVITHKQQGKPVDGRTGPCWCMRPS